MNGPLRWALFAAAGVAFLVMIAAALTVAWIAFRSTFDAYSPSQEIGPQVVIGLDLSADNPLVTDKDFARQAGRLIEDVIAALPLRSLVSVRAFGDYGATPSVVTFDRVISARRTSDGVGRFVGRIVGGIPTLIERKEVDVQTRTNILAFLENMSQAVDCKARPTRFYLVTDGLEDSEYAALAEPDSALPEPQAAIFAGCDHLHIFGIGQGQASPKTASRIKEAWNAWSKQAGFKAFKGLEQW